MDELILKQLTDFNQSYKELDKIYHAYAVSCGISDSTLWLLYLLYTGSGSYTQKELCDKWSYTPQTINSSLKNLEKQGLIELCFVDGNKKNKEIFLTDEGKKLAHRVIEPLVNAEQTSFANLSAQDRSVLLSITEKHIRLFKSELEKTE